MSGVAINSVCIKEVYNKSGDCCHLTFFFVPPIFMNDVLHDVICLISIDSTFTLNNFDIEQLGFEHSWKV